ncbi:MAG: T9SS type A sorting domain-containing protein [Bacteroidales bacterium]|nr:T9SS type A sorting domain-containing protein [Bacteroidales bacterium]MCF8404426.1 T9SS type A sorting domain-containing protein [Bacteroidales bacterium]
MKQIKLICFSIAFLINVICSLSVSGQSTGPDNETGYIDDDPAFWAGMADLVLSPESGALLLPLEVDNSQLMYFIQRINPQTGEPQRELYIQNGNGACAAVSTVHYNLTYELNRAREVSGLLDENKYPANFTWNFLNGGNYAAGSTFSDNLEILERNGCPNGIEWGVWDPAEYTMWMHGYDKYFSAYNNRIEGYSKISPMHNPEKLELMKHWLADHNEGAETGGLISFATGGACTSTEFLLSPSNHAGEEVVVDWGSACNHGMAIVGYCQDIVWDFNGDGQYTNTIDLNADNIIDVRDWEIGAFNVVHLASNYNVAQEGFVWVMFKTMAECTNQNAYVLHVEPDYGPEIEIKGKLTHNKRNNIKVRLAYGENANSLPPVSGWENTLFKNRGGANPMQGIGYDPWLEFSLNYGEYFSQEEFGKIFLRINSNSSEAGTLNSWKLVDRRWGEVFEIDFPITNINLPVNSDLVFEIPYDLIHHESNIEGNLTFDSDMVSRFNPTVSNGATLTVDDGVNIDMYESELEISQNSSLVIDDNAAFIAKKGICKITVDGSISIGSGVSFIAEEGAQLQLRLNNSNAAVNIAGATFDGAAIISYIDELTISNTDFDEGGIHAYKGDLIVNTCSFTQSFAYFSNAAYSNSKVVIDNSDFINSNGSFAVKINDYPDFTIENSTFEEGVYGLYLYNSGYGRYGGEVNNCQITSNSQTAIHIYNSDVDILHNTISGNLMGVKCFNNSNVKIQGNNHDLSQEIKDNTYYEVYASEGAFPYYFHYNGIIDEDNTEAMVYYSGPTGGELNLDVTNNYWGNSFSASTDLYPSSSYTWLPFWTPAGSKSGDVIESLYNIAKNKIEVEDYTGAKLDFQNIVEQYPLSQYAKASLREIFAIEEFGANSFSELQTYFNSVTQDSDVPELIKVAEYLSNFCNIKTHNWAPAIDWFENIIANPMNMEDSIFAVIDLGYTYLQMENAGQKSTYIGSMPNHVPESIETYNSDRDYLLSLLPGELMSEEMQQNLLQLKDGELLYNVPNPFNGNTQFWYKTESTCKIRISIFDYMGRQISTLDIGEKEKGSHAVQFNAEGLAPGIYFYKLEISGQMADSKKMTIIK